MTDKANKLEELMNELLETFVAKNTDYGDSFAESFKEFGIVSAVVRMNDKMNRIKSLSKKGGRQVKDESLRDSLMDLANYALMTVVELDQQIDEWKKENTGTIERPDAFEAAVKDCERESNLENNLDSSYQRIESLDDDKKYYLKSLLSGIEEEYNYVNIKSAGKGYTLNNKYSMFGYQTEFSKIDIRWLVRDWNVNLDDFDIVEVESDYEAGRQENL